MLPSLPQVSLFRMTCHCVCIGNGSTTPDLRVKPSVRLDLEEGTFEAKLALAGDLPHSFSP